jgi:hypothetical protein
VPLDQAGFEHSMPSDRPGIVMRRMLRELLERHGETEARLPSVKPRLIVVQPSEAAE